MKTSRISLGIAAIATVLAATAVQAAEPTNPATNEYMRQQNVQRPLPGTHESRVADRKAQRAKVKEQAKNGEMPEPGDDWGMNKNQPAKLSGTHQTRVVERKEKREEMKQVVKAGDLPVTNEANVGATKKTP